jgi:C-terminal processing protease CtpA/Prc
VEHYKLGILVGEQTAGTNGNVNHIYLPGGYLVRFTGMKVLKQDKSRHHGVGIAPTVPIHRTILGVRNGRDEILERAIQELQNQIQPLPQEAAVKSEARAQ